MGPAVATVVHQVASALQDSSQFDPVRGRDGAVLQFGRYCWRWAAGGLPNVTERRNHTIRPELSVDAADTTDRLAGYGRANGTRAQACRGVGIPDDIAECRPFDLPDRRSQEPLAIRKQDPGSDHHSEHHRRGIIYDRRAKPRSIGISSGCRYRGL